MSTITNHYNVPVSSRFYDFLQEDRESADPQALIASAAKKSEMKKEKKSKDKVEKRLKQIAEAKKENKEELAVKDAVKVEDQVKNNDPVKVIESIIKVEEHAEKILEEKPKTQEAVEVIREESSVEQKDENHAERGQRGRGNYRRGGRGGNFRNGDKVPNDDSEYRPHNQTFQRPPGSNRGRPYRRDRNDERDDSFNEVGYFEEHPQTGYRGGENRRRPYSRGARFPRGNDRMRNDEFPNEISNNVSGENIEKVEDASERGPPRTPRGRYPRANRGGFNRFQRPDTEEGTDFRPNRMGYFDENMDNREYRGRGYSRGGRGSRRGGRGDFRGQREQDNADVSQGDRSEVPVPTPIDAWATVEDEFECTDKVTTTVVPDKDNEAVPVVEDKSRDWGEIEDDPMEAKEEVKVTMTLEEWKAHNAGGDRIINYTASGKEIRKANDGQDVFSGMSEYRKGRSAEDQADDQDHEQEHVHEAAVQGRQKQPITMSVRFSRNVDYSDPISGLPVEPGRTETGRGYSRTFTPRGRDQRGGRANDGSEYHHGGYGGGQDRGQQDQSGDESQRWSRGGSYYRGRGRGGGGGGAADFRGDDDRSNRRGRGSSDFGRRDRGGSQFTRRPDTNVDGGQDPESVMDERTGSNQIESRARGGSDFSRRGRGGSDFVRHDRGGGSGTFVDDRMDPDVNMEDRSGSFVSSRGRGGSSDYVRRERGGSEFVRRGRGGSGGGGGYVDGRHESEAQNDDGSVAHDRPRPGGSTDYERRDRGGSSELSKRGRGGPEWRNESEYNNIDDRGGRGGSSSFFRRDRGGSDFGRRPARQVINDGDEAAVDAELDFGRRGARPGSEYRGRGSSFYRGGGGGGGRKDDQEAAIDGEVTDDRGSGGTRGRPSGYRGSGSGSGSGQARVVLYTGRIGGGGGGPPRTSADRQYQPRQQQPQQQQHQDDHHNYDSSEPGPPRSVNINLGNEDEFPQLS